MRSFLPGLMLSICGAAAFAQSATFARLAPLPGPEFDGSACYWIDGGKGWQRAPWRRGTSAAVRAIAPEGRWATSRDGWTVDAARYKKVGAAGHRGAAAEALEPYAGYKFTPGLPFGALLARDQTDTLHDLSKADTSVIFEVNSMYIDFRINDTGLGDNGGSLRVCMIDREKI